MELSELGEFALIDRLTADFNTRVPSTILGVGDDASVLTAPEAEQELLVSTDMFLEGVHFDLVYVPLKHLGFKAVSANVSDIVAMGGVAEQITVSVGVSARFKVEDLEALYGGIHEACEVYGVDLIGGDTTASVTGLTISVTVIGRVPKGKAIRRSGAQLHDLLCVSGNVGAAYMGLTLCEREKVAFNGSPDFTPRFEGREYILQRLLRPYARVDVWAALQQAGVTPTAMIDVSDGLSSEVLHIAKASGVGILLYEDKIPIDTETILMAEEVNIPPLTAALHGGEDYELLFTVPLGLKDVVETVPDVSIIGHTTNDTTDCYLVTRGGQQIPLTAQGFEHMQSKETDFIAS